MHTRNFLFCVLVLLAGLNTKTHAQALLNFQLGCLGFDNAATPVCTSPVIVRAETCFQLQNGIALLLPASPGLFVEKCSVSTEKPQDLFEIKLMPNPVVSRLMVMAVDNNNKWSNTETVVLSLFDATGRLLKTNATDLLSLKTGYLLDMSPMTAGNYQLKAQLRGNQSIISSIIKIQ